MNHPALATSRLQLRPLAVGDAPMLLAYYERNAAYLEPWEPMRGPAFYTIAKQRSDIAAAVEDSRKGLCARFVAFEAEGREIAASVNLSNIRRGVNHAAIVGYSVDERSAGRGYATEMLNAVVRYAFDELRLHRIEASYQPTNHASGRVLEKAGFAIEGYARLSVPQRRLARRRTREPPQLRLDE